MKNWVPTFRLPQVRQRKPETYMRTALAGDALHERREVEAGELPFEFMLNALRLVEGFPAELFQRRTGLPLLAIEDELAQAEADGLLERSHATVRPTPKGQRFLNELLERFLPGTQPRRLRRVISISTPGTGHPS